MWYMPYIKFDDTQPLDRNFQTGNRFHDIELVGVNLINVIIKVTPASANARWRFRLFRPTALEHLQPKIGKIWRKVDTYLPSRTFINSTVRFHWGFTVISHPSPTAWSFVSCMVKKREITASHEHISAGDNFIHYGDGRRRKSSWNTGVGQRL